MPVIPQIVEGAGTDELNNNRLNTSAFIAANPILVTLIPRIAVKTGSGTSYLNQAPRPAQVVRLIDLGTGAGPGRTETGLQRKDLFQLLLPYDGAVGLYDYWVGADGIRYEVTGLLPYNGYERRAEVTRFGQAG